MFKKENDVVMTDFENELIKEIKDKGADFYYFVDISQLSGEQNKNFPHAILIGLVLSPAYLQKITNTKNYVLKMKQNNETQRDEFNLKERKTDRLADEIAEFIKSKGFGSYSQSEDNIYKTGDYNEKTKHTPLPHKTIALMAGMGWIGKHNLLINPDYGSAISICTVLTNAPIKTILSPTISSKCGDCNVCETICPVNAIKGNEWETNTSRDELVDVYSCTTCLECLVFCPWTQKYIRENSNI